MKISGKKETFHFDTSKGFKGHSKRSNRNFGIFYRPQIDADYMRNFINISQEFTSASETRF